MQIDFRGLYLRGYLGLFSTVKVFFLWTNETSTKYFCYLEFKIRKIELHPSSYTVQIKERLRAHSQITSV